MPTKARLAASSSPCIPPEPTTFRDSRVNQPRHIMLVLSCLPAVAARKPSFIWFNPDEMRAESAYVEVVMPNLDRLAAGGVRFKQCHTSHTTCSQSRASFMTGWPTHVSGHRSLWSLVRDSEPNIFRYLHDDGYDVSWWGKNDNLEDVAMSHSTMHREGGVGSNHNGTKLWAQGDPRYYSFLYPPLNAAQANKTQDWYNVNKAIEFLRARTPSSPPFMMFLPLLLPHPPYSCPEPWHSSVDPATVSMHRPISTEVHGKPDYHALLRKYTHQDQLNVTETEALYRQVRAVYLGCMAYSDYLLGLLLDALDETGLAKETAVMHFADHGDFAGDWCELRSRPPDLWLLMLLCPLAVCSPATDREVRGARLASTGGSSRNGRAVWRMCSRECRSRCALPSCRRPSRAPRCPTSCSSLTSSQLRSSLPQSSPSMCTSRARSLRTHVLPASGVAPSAPHSGATRTRACRLSSLPPYRSSLAQVLELQATAERFRASRVCLLRGRLRDERGSRS